MCFLTIQEQICLSQGIDRMQQSLADSLVIYVNAATIDVTSFNTYITQMATTMKNLGAIETFFFRYLQFLYNTQIYIFIDNLIFK